MSFEIPMRVGEAPRRTALNAIKQRALLQMVQGQGWPVMLQLMEEEALADQTELMAMDGRDPAALVAQHALARASWRRFVSMQERVRYECNELMKPKPSEPTPDMAANATILDALQ